MKNAVHTLRENSTVAGWRTAIRFRPVDEGTTQFYGDPGGSRTPNPQFRRLMLYPVELRGRIREGNFGVGNGNRTRNRRSHSPVLCQLSYSHRRAFIIAIEVWRAADPRRERFANSKRPSFYTRPTPTYSNPSARKRTESRRFLVSTMTGFFSRFLMRSKSSARNSGQPVPTTSASEPSAAA
jgi:hypothetical protein